MTSPQDDAPTRAPRRAVRPLVTAALLIGLVLRLAFGLGYWIDKPLTLDEREYLLLAQNIATGQGFQYRLPDGSAAPGEHFGRAPLYPLLLAGLMRATGERLVVSGSGSAAVLVPSPALLWAIKVTQAGIGALTIWLIALLAWRASGPKAAMVAAWLAALYPPLVWTPAYVFSETFYGALALGCVAVVDAAVRRSTEATPRTALASSILLGAGGLIAGLAVLTRPAMLFFVMLAAPWLWRRRGWIAASSFVIAAALVVAPWTMRNLREHGRFVLVASEGGVTFWTGNHPLAIGEGDMAANTDIKRVNREFREARPGLTPEQLEPLYYQDAISWIAANPGSFGVLIARKAFYTVVPIGPSYRLHSPRYFWASVVAYLAVLPFGVLGLVRRSADLQSLLVLVASAVLVCLIFFPQERFRIPVIDPALVVGAACWWARRSDGATIAARGART